MRRRRCTRAEVVGYGAVLVGGVILIGEPIESASKVLIVVGALVVGFARLEARSKASDETYRIGYDIGREDGYRERDEELSSVRGVVVPIRSDKAKTRQGAER